MQQRYTQRRKFFFMKKLVAVILTLTLLLAAAAVPGLAASTLTPGHLSGHRHRLYGRRHRSRYGG